MSAQLSTILFIYSSITYSHNKALQIAGFRDIHEDRVILGLPSALENSRRAMAIGGGGRDGLEEVLRAHMEGARASHQEASRGQHLQRAQVQFLVSAEGFFKVPLCLGEGRWIEDDRVVSAV